MLLQLERFNEFVKPSETFAKYNKLLHAFSEPQNYHSYVKASISPVLFDLTRKPEVLNCHFACIILANGTEGKALISS